MKAPGTGAGSDGGQRWQWKRRSRCLVVGRKEGRKERNGRKEWKNEREGMKEEMNDGIQGRKEGRKEGMPMLTEI